MEIENKSNFWKGKKIIEARRLTGYLLAKGGIAITSKNSLAWDYREILFGFRVPGLINGRTARSIEDLYEEAIAEGVIIPMREDCYRDTAEYLISIMETERILNKPFFVDEYKAETYKPSPGPLGDEFTKEEE